MAELVIRINLSTGERSMQIRDTLKDIGIVESKYRLTQSDIINLITEYYKITFEELLNYIESKEDKYVLPKKLICYFLQRRLGIEYKEINKLLKYKEKSNIVQLNIKYVDQMIKNKDSKYIRPVNNLNLIFNRYTAVKDNLG